MEVEGVALRLIVGKIRERRWEGWEVGQGDR